MADEIASLRVALEAQTAEFNKALDSTARRIERFEKRATKSLKTTSGSLGGLQKSFATFSKGLGMLGVGLSLGAVVSTLTGAAKAAISYGDDIAKASAKTGVGVQAFSQLAYAAKQSDIDMVSLGNAFKKLQVAISNAGTGAKQPLEAFAALGIEFGSLRELAPEEQFLLIGQQISLLKDPADRARAATELFGKAGADLLPMFEQGAAGIRAFMQEADRVGASMTPEQVARLAEADDAIKRMGQAWDGLARTLTASVAPALTGVFNLVTAGLASNTDDVGKFQKAWLLLLRVMTRGSPSAMLAGAIQEMGRMVATAGEASAPLGSSARTRAMSRTPAPPAGAAPPGYLPGAGTGGKGAADKAAAEIERATEAISKQVEALKQQAITAGWSDEAIMQYRVTLGDLADEFAKAGPNAEQYKAQLVMLTGEVERNEAATKKAADAQAAHDALLAEGRSLVESLRDPYEVASAAVDRYNLLLAEGAITAAEFDDAMLHLSEGLAETAKAATKSSDEMSIQWDQALRNMQDILADSLFNSFDDGLQNMLYQWANALKRMAMEALAANIFGALTAGAQKAAGGGGFWGSIFSGILGAFGGSLGGGGGGIGVINGFDFASIGLAKGGPVSPGKLYLAGEQGPEFIVPRQPGMVLPTNVTRAMVDRLALGDGGRAPINVTFNIETPDPDAFARTQTQIQARMQRTLARASARKN